MQLRPVQHASLLAGEKRRSRGVQGESDWQLIYLAEHGLTVYEAERILQYHAECNAFPDSDFSWTHVSYSDNRRALLPPLCPTRNRTETDDARYPASTCTISNHPVKNPQRRCLRGSLLCRLLVLLHAIAALERAVREVARP